jgi:hypothetical protein
VSTYGTGTYGAIGGTYGDLTGTAPTIPTDLTVYFDVAWTDAPGVVSPTWTNIAADLNGTRLQDFTIARGRQMELDEIETGQLVGTLRNQDRALDPLLPTATYYPNVVPIRQSRLRAAVLGVEYDLFRGDIQDWPQDWQGVLNLTPVDALDAFDALADAEFTDDRPAELSGARINAILDAIGWPAGMREIDTGQSTMKPITYETANAKTELQLVGRSEQGVVFVGPTGNIVFHERHRRWKTPYNVSQATFSNQPTGSEVPFADATLVYTKNRIRNYVTVTQTGGVTEVRSDATSITNYRRRAVSLETIQDSTNEVGYLAEWLLEKGKDPIARVEEVVLEPQLDDDLWAQALGRELGDRITVTIRPPGTTATTITTDGVIERIEHSFQAETRRWRTSFKLSPAEVSQFWIAADATFGLAGTTTRASY